jgi:hypothetical protein
VGTTGFLWVSCLSAVIVITGRMGRGGSCLTRPTEPYGCCFNSKSNTEVRRRILKTPYHSACKSEHNIQSLPSLNRSSSSISSQSCPLKSSSTDYNQPTQPFP